MQIESIEVRNVLSFGPQKQEFQSFKTMNLFIGKNGSGKSNALRLIGDITFEYQKLRLGMNVQVAPDQTVRTVPVFGARLKKDFISNRLPKTLIDGGLGDLVLRYKTLKHFSVDGELKTFDNYPLTIEFKNGFLCRGDVSDLSGPFKICNVTSDWDDMAFSNSLRRDGDHFQTNAILIFGLRYIFQRDYIVGTGGYFAELHTRRQSDGGRTSNGGSGGFDKSLWPEGVLRVAKIIQQATFGSVVLLEEPELGLEPRAVRRFADFLRWLATPDEGIESSSEKARFVHSAWQDYVAGIQSSRKEDVRMPTRRKLQYFITSHSPVLLSNILESKDDGMVYEFSMEWMENGFDPNDPQMSGCRTEEESKAGWVEQKSLWSKVRKIDSDVHVTLDAVGASGADILQCNGVVGVEGPSDVIYLREWLRMHARKEGRKQLVQGQHYEFQMYGGSLLDSLCLQQLDNSPNSERQKLVEMFSFSRNAYVVMDSDAVTSEAGKIVDKSTYVAAKQFIKNQIAILNSRGYKIGLWFAEDDTSLRTIEDYLDEASKSAVGASLPKRVAAERRTAQWSSKILLDFPAVAPEIEKLYEQILAWQAH